MSDDGALDPAAPPPLDPGPVLTLSRLTSHSLNKDGRGKKLPTRTTAYRLALSARSAGLEDRIASMEEAAFMDVFAELRVPWAGGSILCRHIGFMPPSNSALWSSVGSALAIAKLSQGEEAAARRGFEKALGLLDDAPEFDRPLQALMREGGRKHFLVGELEQKHERGEVFWKIFLDNPEIGAWIQGALIAKSAPSPRAASAPKRTL